LLATAQGCSASNVTLAAVRSILRGFNSSKRWSVRSILWYIPRRDGECSTRPRSRACPADAEGSSRCAPWRRNGANQPIRRQILALDQSRAKARSSALTMSFNVVHMPCGAFNDLERCVLDDLARQQRGIRHRHDLIIVAVKNQGWHVEPFRSWVRSVSEKPRYRNMTPGNQRSCSAAKTTGVRLRRSRRRTGCSCRRVGSDRGRASNGRRRRQPGVIEGLDRSAAGIGFRLQHQRRNSADQDGFCNALGAVPADIARRFAPTRRMADMDGVLQIERLHKRGEIVGVVSMSLPCQSWL
jgi:hypothetical protein